MNTNNDANEELDCDTCDTDPTVGPFECDHCGKWADAIYPQPDGAQLCAPCDFDAVLAMPSFEAEVMAEHAEKTRRRSAR